MSHICIPRSRKSVAAITVRKTTEPGPSSTSPGLTATLPNTHDELCCSLRDYSSFNFNSLADKATGLAR